MIGEKSTSVDLEVISECLVSLQETNERGNMEEVGKEGGGVVSGGRVGGGDYLRRASLMFLNRPSDETRD